jgi:hypothetical protein
MHGGGGGGGGHLKRVWDIINKLSHYERLDKTVPPQSRHFLSQSESAPTSALWRMDGKWSGNGFPLGSSSLANHDA